MLSFHISLPFIHVDRQPHHIDTADLGIVVSVFEISFSCDNYTEHNHVHYIYVILYIHKYVNME